MLQTIAYLKSKFETGDIPTQQDFYDLLESYLHLSEIVQASGASLTNVMSQKAVTDALTAISGGVIIAATYANIAALLAGQGAQVTGKWYMVTTATGDPSVTTGWAIYQKLAATTGAIGDYQKIAEQESLDISLPTASTSVSGIVELSTPAEDITGTDATRAVTPLGLNGKVVGLQDLNISAVAFWPRGTNGATDISQEDMTTSLFRVQFLEFDETVTNIAQCQLVFPRKMAFGTIRAKIYWKPAAAGAGDVEWGLAAVAYSDGDALTTAPGTVQVITDTYIGPNTLHVTSYTPAVTIAGSPVSADMLLIQISRTPTNAGDTLNVKARLVMISLEITTNAAKDA